SSIMGVVVELESRSIPLAAPPDSGKQSPGRNICRTNCVWTPLNEPLFPGRVPHRTWVEKDGPEPPPTLLLCGQRVAGGNKSLIPPSTMRLPMCLFNFYSRFISGN